MRFIPQWWLVKDRAKRFPKTWQIFHLLFTLSGGALFIGKTKSIFYVGSWNNGATHGFAIPRWAFGKI